MTFISIYDGVDDMTTTWQRHDNNITTPPYELPLISADYADIFRFNVKDKDMSVPPMEFTVDATRWEAPANRLPSRHISVEKQALNKMINDLLALEVIQPSGSTAWSQVHLVRKPSNGWRFTVQIFVIQTKLFRTRDGKSWTWWKKWLKGLGTQVHHDSRLPIYQVSFRCH